MRGRTSWGQGQVVESVPVVKGGQKLIGDIGAVLYMFCDVIEEILVGIVFLLGAFGFCCYGNI